MEAILNKTITTEFEGQFSLVTLGSMADFLINMYEIAISKEDFIRKAINGMTDETNDLSDGDKTTLGDLYLYLFCNRY